MKLLAGVVRPYAWGSRTALAELRGTPSPSPHPEAELWFGAHPASPARICGEVEGPQDLLGVIEADPVRELGAETADQFGSRLPYLLKILAAQEPLSLQAHPSLEQAVAGFERENAAGLALDAPDRNYRDPSHKPELVVALTEFDALAGFRDPHVTVEILKALAVPALDPYLGMLVEQPDETGLRAVFTTWLTLPEAVIGALVPEVLNGAVRVLGGDDDRFTLELRSLLELGEAYPGDPGVLASLLLNRIRLQPGEGIYLSAGNLHAYLHGMAVELMANSDNVLRGGLTPKHIDVPELLRVLDFHPVSIDALMPQVRSLGTERVYLTPAPEFRLSRVELDGTGLHAAQSISFEMAGPQILAVISGRVAVEGSGGELLKAGPGDAVWLSAADPDVVVRAISSGAVFFRAMVPALQH
ncbi:MULTISPECIES: mannose-6-phosphate isomerase, class I [Gordonia]|uniref:mannose-6-phosphate isomerase n=2 Tax=Gordonia TaxID=2053 RepID=L7LHB6_9ACTN|nr:MULTISPECIES: mannose-6-phosphate isomerase, class I [Gordonia]AUH68388.1 mannose-6-phosphate isomerase, class I [Gordonia sp. YC-JH1]KJR00784.1 mannose-6-phosphate isomerase [Gordonia sihwensis]KXT57644.1 mannose-6-phosphate isomerase [Gordonia sp. QH-12]MBY4570951.1 mannose-6-phosphate isomerase, class I [Gordonia sihwensis]WFN91829.1 mannose-6-phosphate isomerase, class I [Gordonia sihwensis]